MNELYPHQITEQEQLQRSEISPEHALSSIIKAVSGLRFGQVTIVVHEGKVVQIERMERQRISKPT